MEAARICESRGQKLWTVQNINYQIKVLQHFALTVVEQYGWLFMGDTVYIGLTYNISVCILQCRPLALISERTTKTTTAAAAAAAAAAATITTWVWSRWPSG